MNTSQTESYRCQPPIAIVGMACEFPGAHSPAELWENVLAGRRYFRKAPTERMPPEYFDPDPKAPDKSYQDLIAVIEGWQFDPFKFRIPPITFRASDMVHWLALYVADAAVRHSRLDLSSVDQARAAVIIGNTLTGEFNRSHYLRLRWPYAERALRQALSSSGVDGAGSAQIVAAFKDVYNGPLPEGSEDSLAGNMSNTIAGRISNYLNFGGGSFTVDGACSSALLSIVIASDALRDGRLDVALAGGVDVSLDPFEIIGFAKAQALAREDIRPYDERANGMLTGEGCGVFVLMREEDARTRGLTIYAVLKGWAFASDGKGAITAPEVEGQCRTLRKVYEQAGYPMASAGLIEGHGTGTPLGDRVELAAISRVLGDSTDGGDCAIGSIKANIGHCKAAAGAAALIKAIYALNDRLLPPTLNCERPHPLFAQTGGRLRPSVKARIWEAKGRPRRVSVSAMGFGGANAHVTLEEANPDGTPALDRLRLAGSHQASELIPLAAADLAGLQAQLGQLLPLARRICLAELTDLAAALAKRPAAGSLRLAFVTSSPWQLVTALEHCAQALEQGQDLSKLHDPANGIHAGRTVEHPKCVGLFPGQGSQRLNMGERFRERFPLAAELHEHLPAEVAPQIQAGFRELLGAAEENVTVWEQELRNTRNAQPAIVASSLAGLRVLRSLGLEPDAFLGHSLGEITALHAAGVLDENTALRVAALRGRTMSELALPEPGGMLAVGASADQVEPLLRALDSSLVISNFNSPRQTVVSGRAVALQALKAACEREGMRGTLLPVSHAFHSDLVAPAAEVFRRALAGAAVQTQKPRRTFISTVSGQAAGADTDWLEYLAGQVRQPVRFVDAVRHAADTQPHLWVEIGPGGVLTALVRDMLGSEQAPCCPTDLKGEDALHTLNQLLAQAFVLGFPLRLDQLFASRFHRPFDIENYRPVFITNPCERPVELPEAPKVNLASIGESPFLREFAELYQRHHSEKSEVRSAKSGSADKLTPAAPAEAGTPTLLDFAIRWIAKRTGFPEDRITPDQKLRDDLGLDSIKAGELVLNLSRELQRPFAGDPAMFANSSLGDIVTAMEATPTDSPADEARRKRRSPAGDIQSLDHWIRSFRMVGVPYPVSEEQARPLPQTGRFFIFAVEGCPAARALSDALRQRGLQVTVTTPDALATLGDSPADLTGMVVFLPAVNRPFYDCSPAEFSQRVEGTSEMLFRLFRWFGHGRPTDWSNLHLLVVRPVAQISQSAVSQVSKPAAGRVAARSAGLEDGDPADSGVGATDPGADLDAGAAFLKSLRLEFTDASPKWLSLPADWGAQQTADTVLAELETTSERVSRHYTADGQRFTEVALPLGQSSDRPPKVGAEDVIVITGGAKGITAELALGLGRFTKAKLALLGSSPPPASDATAQESEIARNLKRFAEAGLTCGYYQCDVTDGQAVQSAVTQAEKELGPITGILHGSGISKLQRFAEQPIEEFLDCIRVKADGLYHLLQCVPPSRLKLLHAVSSVLGKTGMRGQTDYTLANAWLDGAVRSVKAAYPHLHCLTLGYSVWGDTGLGKRLGVLDYLVSMGVRPISTDEGVAEYLELLRHADNGPVFVTTGNLDPLLESNLYPGTKIVEGRFLERLRHWVPQTELCADATISHQTDLYLPEHVHYGTPLFPGVMAIEAMVQAANACLETDELPVLRNIEFRRPLVIREDESVVIRILALADKAKDGTRRVRVAIRSDRDQFTADHFAAECWYGLPEPAAETLPKMPPLPEPLPINPEDLHPVPLFQGKLFRRIQQVLVRSELKEAVTRIEWPEGERYFAKGLPGKLLTLSPAARDTCLQSGAIVASAGCLPDKINELRLWRGKQPVQSVVCHATVASGADGRFVADGALFTDSGELAERISGLVLSMPKTTPPSPPRCAEPVPWERLASDLTELLPDYPHALALVPHEDLDKQPELNNGESSKLRDSVSEARHAAIVGNLIAARRAAEQYALQHRGETVLPNQVEIVHRPDGKPGLRVIDPALEGVFEGVDVSLADGGGFSVAFVGPGSVGVDIEPVAIRSAELWRGLLGDDGYSLALALQRDTHEPFDTAASRVWSLLEAGKKANTVERILPAYLSPLGASWLSFEAGHPKTEFINAVADADRSHLCLAVGYARQPAASASATSSTQDSFQQVLDEFTRHMARLEAEGEKDPGQPDTEQRHRAFLTVGERAAARLFALAKSADAQAVKSMQRTFQNAVRSFLGDSGNFRHTLEKPYGYAGDFKLLDMLAANSPTSRGLGWHFDRWQLDYPASVACRNRIQWIRSEIAALLTEAPSRTLTILDIGIGAAPIERLLASDFPDAKVNILAVDVEPRALDFVSRSLAGGARTIETVHLDLRGEAVASRVKELAERADICIAVGILEALNDGQAERLLKSLFDGLRQEATVYAENFIPTHPTGPFMEWFMDFHLGNRTEAALRGLFTRAGFSSARIETRLEETASLCLLKCRKLPRATGATPPVRDTVAAFTSGLEKLQAAAVNDPDAACCEENYTRLQENTNATAQRLNDAIKGLEPGEVRAVRQSMYATVKAFLDGSESCLRCLTKPLGYPGDYLLMEQILTGTNRSRGLAYHCDRFFLSQPGCEAIRQRTAWATHEIELLLKRASQETARILDLGCGPMAIENDLQKTLTPDKVIELVGVDNDTAALRFAASRLRHATLRLSTRQMNLLTEAGIAALGALAGNSDAVVSMGLIEYFSDETVLLLLSELSRNMRLGTRLLLGNYQPDHPSRAVMEWCLDWWLVYRTEAQLRRLLEQAAFEAQKIHTELDPTGSIVLAHITR